LDHVDDRGPVLEGRRSSFIANVLLGVLVLAVGLMQLYSAPMSTVTVPILAKTSKIAPLHFFQQGWQLFAPLPPEDSRVILARFECGGSADIHDLPYLNVGDSIFAEAKRKLVLQDREARGLAHLAMNIAPKNAFYINVLQYNRVARPDLPVEMSHEEALRVGTGYAKVARRSMGRFLFLRGARYCSGTTPTAVQYSVLTVPVRGPQSVKAGSLLYQSPVVQRRDVGL
jgi:hypothetical protein